MYRLHFITFCRNCLCWETKNGIRDSHEKSTRFGILFKKKRERGIRTPPPFPDPVLNLLSRVFSAEMSLLPSSLFLGQLFPATHKFLKGQIIGKRMKTKIYTFISTEFLFSRHKIDYLRPIIDLKVSSQGEGSR